MSTEITTKKPQGMKELINSESMRTQFALALPKHLSPERFARVAITALTRTPKLADCTPSSLMKCLLDLSAMGLEPDGRRAHLIPFENRKLGIVECTLIVDFKGLVELIRRSGDVVSIRSETVCAKDEFAWTNGEVTHSVNWREDRGAMQAVYAEAVMKSGEKQSAVMTKAEVEAIRSRSRSGTSGPWVTDFGEMAKKTVVRRLSKMLPLSSEIIRHVERDDDQFQMRNVTPSTPSFILPQMETFEESEPPAIETLTGGESHSA
jgi:recombination protein RecT